MIRVQNRTPAPGQEGRVTLTPESGNPTTGVLAMADNATQPGTPWNRETGRLLQGDIRTAAVAAGQSIEVGDIVDLDSDGKAGVSVVSTPARFYATGGSVDWEYACRWSTVIPLSTGEYFAISPPTDGDLSPAGVILSPTGLCLQQFPTEILQSGTTTISPYYKQIFAFEADSRHIILIYFKDSYDAILTGYSRTSATNSWAVGTVSAMSSTDLGAPGTGAAGMACVLLDAGALCFVLNNAGLQCTVRVILAGYNSGFFKQELGNSPVDGNTESYDYISAALRSSTPTSEGVEYTGLLICGKSSISLSTAYTFTIEVNNGLVNVEFGPAVTLSLGQITDLSLLATGPDSALLGYLPPDGTFKMASLQIAGSSVALNASEITVGTGVTGIQLVGNPSTTPVALWTTGAAAYAATLSAGPALSIGTPFQFQTSSDVPLGTPNAAILPGGNLLATVGVYDPDSPETGPRLSGVLAARGSEMAGGFQQQAMQAVALQSGGPGDVIELLYNGTAEAPGIAAGAWVTSNGGAGYYAPVDGWISVSPFWARPQVVMGSYEGTGAHGADSPNTLTFPFEPKLVLICPKNNWNMGIFARGIERVGATWQQGSGRTSIVTWNENGLEWYSNDGSSYQFNSEGTTYIYLAIG